VTAAAISPDGKRVAAGGKGGVTRVWEAANAAAPSEHKNAAKAAVTHLALSNTHAAALDATGGAAVWPATDPEGETKVTWHGTAKVTGLALHPTGRYLATGAGDGTVFLWDATRNTPAHRVTGPGSPVTAVAFSPDGTRLAVATETTVLVWEARSPR
jgi:WD40 repeat protein